MSTANTPSDTQEWLEDMYNLNHTAGTYTVLSTLSSILTYGNILSWRFISTAILSLPLIQEGQNFVGYWLEDVH